MFRGAKEVRQDNLDWEDWEGMEALVVMDGLTVDKDQWVFAANMEGLVDQGYPVCPGEQRSINYPKKFILVCKN